MTQNMDNNLGYFKCVIKSNKHILFIVRHNPTYLTI